MTELSYVWDGTVTGDASYAPYDSETFNMWILSSFLSDSPEDAFVVPGYLNDLWVHNITATHAVVVEAGMAAFNNFIYISDTPKVLNITRGTSGQNRIDVVVLRINYATNRIRLGIVEGTSTPTSFPTEPSLTKTASVYEVPLAAIKVVGGNSYILNQYVYDRRKFLYNLADKTYFNGSYPNLIKNSEWLAFSGNNVAGYAPDNWTMDQTATFSRSAGTFGSGRNYYETNLEYFGQISQWIKTSGKTFTVKLVLDYSLGVAGGGTTVGLHAYRTNGLESSVAIDQSIFTASSTYQEVLFTITFPENDIDKLYFYITDANSDMHVSQILLVPGYHTGGFKAIDEIIMFKRGIPDAAWTSTAKSTGTTLINLSASFSALIPPYTRSVVLRLRGRDSGSAAATNCYLRALGYAAPFNSSYGSVELGGVTNDAWRETIAIVPVDIVGRAGVTIGGAQFRLEVAATGAGTFDATVEVVGILI